MIPKCVSCHGDCKNCLKRPGEAHTSQDQAMADTIADLQQQLADNEADKDK